MFTYNFRRLLNLIGIALFKKLCLAIKNKDLTQIRKDIEEYILMYGHYLAYFLVNIFSFQIVHYQYVYLLLFEYQKMIF